MPAYVALLRAVNVGGSGTLPMTELRAMCTAAGFENVQTYIASGNVVFWADGAEAEVKVALERQLETYAGKPVGVMVSTARQIADVLEMKPFPDCPPNWTVAIFLDTPPDADTIKTLRGVQDEQVQLGKREISVAYGAGIGRSKLKIPAASQGTARNINTNAKLAALAASR